MILIEHFETLLYFLASKFRTVKSSSDELRVIDEIMIMTLPVYSFQHILNSLLGHLLIFIQLSISIY